VTHFKRAILWGVLSALCAGSSLQAATISYSDPIPSSSSPTAGTFTLPEFNPAMGTLTGVEIDFDVHYQAIIQVYNVSGSPQSVGAYSSTPLDMTTPSGLQSDMFTAVYGTSLSPISETVGLGVNTYNGPITETTVPFTESAPNLGLYVGLGTNNYSLSYEPSTSGGSPSGGVIFYGGGASSYGTATVNFTYTPVPEPTSVVLFGLGTMGLIWAAIRRRQK
jgi:hypothetical protein